MNHCWKLVFTTMAFCIAVARADVAPTRPDVNTDKPIAKCKLQSVGDRPSAAPVPSPVGFTIARSVDDPLINYERTELGTWRMPGNAAISDPWIRLLVVGPKRPLVVDVAVFIDGKTFREAREAWIDDMLAPPASAASEQVASKSPGAVEGNKSPESIGTETKDAASNAKASKTEDDDKSSGDSAAEVVDAKQGDAKSEEVAEPQTPKPEGDDTESEAPGVAAQSRQMPLMRERLTHYLAANGTNVERDEIHWLIAEWGSGPGVVVLGPALSWQRARVAALEALIDDDRNGALSAAEIAGAEEMLRRADHDGNEVVDLSEIRRAHRHEAAAPFSMGHSLVVVLDSNTDWDSLATTLASVYTGEIGESAIDPPAAIQARIAQGDPTLTADALPALNETPADVSLRVDFSEGEVPSGASLLGASPGLTAAKDTVTVTDSVISLDVGSDVLEFSAGAAGGDKGSATAESQIAVGAVIDGNPILRILDQDQDQRLTVRERQELQGLLTSFDRDSDGQLAAAEMPIPIRLAITRGPHVHEMLAKSTGAARKIAPREAAPPPDWFTSMDKNRDRDLSRDEFLGTTKQFKQFDADGDGMLNVAEALKLNGGE